MTLSEELAWRGLIKDKTFTDASWLNEPKKFYMGIDASSDSLTVGNLAFLMLGRHLVEAGWKPILVMGGGTSLVGDPGGKTEERQLKSREEIQKNIEGIQSQVTKIFEGKSYEMVDNYDWLSNLKYVDFLREVGKHFSMTELMQRDFVAERMGEGAAGISYAEFSYSLVQGYDFWHLFRNHDVRMQIGGSDQWGNMLSGVALIRKKEGKEVHAFSMPLLVNKETGQKFGKSELGAIWLDPSKTPHNQFYQFWINTSDSDVEDYLKKFTMLAKEEIEHIVGQHKQDLSKRFAQERLAEEVTNLVHGLEVSEAAGLTAEYLTGRVSIRNATDEDIQALKKEIPSIEVKVDNLHLRQTLVDVGLASSRTEAERLLQAGAIYINGEKYTGPDSRQLFIKGLNLVRRGKAFKDTALVELT